MSLLKEIKDDLQKAVIPGKAKELMRFFKTGPGDYGEGDLFIGVTVPEQRKIARRHHKEIPLAELEKLLQDPCHECRLTALFILRLRYEKEKSAPQQKKLVQLYLNNLDYVNNWDLVDSSAPYILGPHLYGKDPALLYELADSGNLWRQRVAVLTTAYFIRQGNFDHTLKLAELLLDHPHDLIHKAVGWMLREVGNRDPECELAFLKKHHRRMPRTMLRYAIEKFDPYTRQKILKGQA
ncbi:MAG: DNA alkylation repair protein [Firmicutes bacterium]|nr:DNA alkylation repair protein [Bacillota bacterium]